MAHSLCSGWEIAGAALPLLMTSWDKQRHLSPSAGTDPVCGVVFPVLSLLSKVSNERHADRGTGGGVLRGTGLEEVTYIGLDDESQS